MARNNNSNFNKYYYSKCKLCNSEIPRGKLFCDNECKRGYDILLEVFDIQEDTEENEVAVAR